MSSIYDALQRIQGEKRIWSAPLGQNESPAGKRMAKLVVLAVCVSSLCTAGLFYGVRTFKESRQKAPESSPIAASVSPRNGVLPLASVNSASPAGAGTARMPAPPVQQTVPVEPENVEGYLKAGEQYFTAKDYENALMTYNKALHYFGKDVRLLNNIGNVYLAKGQPDKAIHYFQESNTLSRDYVEPVYNLACAYARLGDKAKAVANLKKACRMNPDAKTWAAQDSDLMVLKGYANFDRVIGAQ